MIKETLIILFGLALLGCSGPRLKKCGVKVEGSSILRCPQVVEGAFRMCEPIDDLYECSDPK